MRPLPYERFIVESKLTPQELARQLAWHIDSPKPLRWPWDPTKKPFEGKIQDRCFNFRTLLKFQRNAFRAVVVGSIEQADRGSVLRAVIRLHWAVAAFMAAWISIPLTVGLLVAAKLVRTNMQEAGFLPFFAFALAGYFLCMGFFWLDVGRVKRILREVARP